MQEVQGQEGSERKDDGQAENLFERTPALPTTRPHISIITGLTEAIIYRRLACPPELQQDELDFLYWRKQEEAGKLGSVYFSWPRGHRARCTVKVDLVNKKVAIKHMAEDLPVDEAFDYVLFATQIRVYLGR